MKNTHSQDISSLLSRIFSGDLSRRSAGFLLHLPPGMSGRKAVLEKVGKTYGAQGHPDLRIIEPQGSSDLIKIDDIRETGGFLASSRSGSGMKTLIILRADRMNDAAANAFLKALEEPTAHTRILLVTDAPYRLPPTILSRSLKLRATASSDEVRGELETLILCFEDKLPPAAKLGRALLFASGRPDDAHAILSGGLLPWCEKITKWLSGSGSHDAPQSAPPLPAFSGKAAAPVPVCARVISGLIHGTITGGAIPGKNGAVIPGWSPERAVSAHSAAASLFSDIDRPGLDGRLRMHNILTTLVS